MNLHFFPFVCVSRALGHHHTSNLTNDHLIQWFYWSRFLGQNIFLIASQFLFDDDNHTHWNRMKFTKKNIAVPSKKLKGIKFHTFFVIIVSIRTFYTCLRTAWALEYLHLERTIHCDEFAQSVFPFTGWISFPKSILHFSKFYYNFDNYIHFEY